MLCMIVDSRIKPDHITPSSKGANSIDLRACIPDSIRIRPGEEVVIEAGIKVAIPEATMGMIIPRSGKGVNGLVIGNLVGNIDPDYRGVVKVCLWNRGIKDHIIEPLERIAQLIVVNCYAPANWTLTHSLDATERGLGSFGSTGRS